MSEQRIIYVDLDDTVGVLMAGWLARYNEDYQDCLTRADITDWDITKAVKPECGKDIYKYLHDKTLYDLVPPMDGALAGVEALRLLNFRVVYLTTSNIHMAGRKPLWLAEHGFLKHPLKHGTNTHEVIEVLGDNKHLLRGWALVDDGPHNLKNFVGHRLLMDQQHNQQATRTDYDHRCADWSAVITRVEQLLLQEVSLW